VGSLALYGSPPCCGTAGVIGSRIIGLRFVEQTRMTVLSVPASAAAAAEAGRAFRSLIGVAPAKSVTAQIASAAKPRSTSDTTILLCTGAVLVAAAIFFAKRRRVSDQPAVTLRVGDNITLTLGDASQLDQIPEEWKQF
jgi:hypothetical protein